MEPETTTTEKGKENKRKRTYTKKIKRNMKRIQKV